MTGIGGFFELELPLKEEYHKQVLKLNSGRNALEYILLANKYKKIYLPYYTCDVLLEPLLKLNIAYEFYKINNEFRPIFDFALIKPEEAFLYTNYFGISDKIIQDIFNLTSNLIIDNSQAFYSNALPGINTFYSPRKFFGISDGAYLYSNKKIDISFEQDVSYDRISHLVGRIDLGAETFFKTFKTNDDLLIGQPIKLMSNLTMRILASIDYPDVAKKRQVNFDNLHSEFHKKNNLKFQLYKNSVPLVYPLYLDHGHILRKNLIENRIYIPTYWPNVFNWCDTESFEYSLTKDCVFLPVDQRYTKDEMSQIIHIVNKYV